MRPDEGALADLLETIDEHAAREPSDMLERLIQQFNANHPTLALLARIIKDHGLELPALTQRLHVESAVVGADLDVSLADLLEGRCPVHEGQVTLKLRW
jgi:hypothetical protein